MGYLAPRVALIVTGVAALPGITLSAIGAGAVIIDLVCVAITHKSTAKAEKLSPIMQVTKTKLN